MDTIDDVNFEELNAMDNLESRLDSFDLYHQSMLCTIREDLAREYQAPPTVLESRLTPGIDAWLLAGNSITKLLPHQTAGYEATLVMLRAYKNTGRPDYAFID